MPSFLPPRRRALRQERRPNGDCVFGYFSPHFRVHAVNYFIEPILLAHHHEQFEIFCYSDSQQQDAVTARLRQAVDGWRDVTAASDEQLVADCA